MNLSKLGETLIICGLPMVVIGSIVAAVTPTEAPKPVGRVSQVENTTIAGQWVTGPAGTVATYYFPSEGGPVLTISTGKNVGADFAVSLGDKGPVMQVVSRDGKTVKHIDLLKLAELLEKAEAAK